VRKLALIAFLAATLIGLLNFSIVMTSWRAESNGGSAKYPFVWEMTGAYTGLLLLPLIAAFIQRYPRRYLLHVPVFVAFAVSHTLLMWGSRVLIYRLLGWGTYDYGDMRYRFFMEGQKQLVVYLLVYALLRFLAYARANRERERELTEARLAALKMQLQPHFLFNALNMIAAHVYETPDVAAAMLQNLSQFLRATLKASQAQEVSLREELEFVESYLAIMRARFEERLKVDVALDDEARETLVPHLLLQPLVENSIAHSLRDHARRAEICIAARRAGDRLRLVIEDNGPGIDGAPSGDGIGLSNTIARLRHLYGERQTLTLHNREEGGLRLTIELPWRTA
jgi:signal transduction histidine kinase